VSAYFVALPYLEKSSTDVEAFEGQDVTFPCIASGVPRPNVTWLSNGKLLGGK
jgi:Immunoglobulin domain